MTSADDIVDGICELTLQAEDVEALARFYCELLDCPEIAREDDRIWLAAGSHARLGIWAPGKKEFGDRGGRHVHFALSCAPGKLDRVARRLDSMDAVHRGPVEHGGGDRSLYVEDPEGNVLELWDFFRRRQGASEGVEALAD